MDRRCAMYVDNLTITAMIVVAIAVGLFVRNCLLKDCGSPCDKIEDCDEGTRHYKL
jgi:hypothetical protein